MRDLYYKVVDNGYHIYDRNDELFHLYQYEPYIPDPSKSYAENAEQQISEILEYQKAQQNGSDEATEQDYINALAELGGD